jgi:hypothetical protein
MDIIGLQYVSVDSSTVQLRYILVADAHAHLQRMVSIVKMATVLVCTTKEQSSVFSFFVGIRTRCKGYS